MCGICGIINFNQSPVEETSIKRMMQIMKHRGPDDDGVFMDGNIGLGYVRLSIIDLTSAGHQPMEDNSGRYVMVFNGEIYNYIELKEELKGKYHFKTHTDSEVLLAAYIVWGDACLHKFNGMFALAIYDKLNKSVFIARDRFGVKPFYYIQTKDYFAFCSEIPPLLTLLNQKPKPNYQSIFDFLVFNRTDQTEQTFFEEVKKLQHGHQCKIQNSELRIKKWYDLREQVKNNTGFKDAKEFRELFNSSIGLRLRSDVPIGVCLSGGLDSSSIVSVLLHDYGKKDLKTFSAVYNKGQTGDETEYIHEYSAFLRNMYYISPDASSLEKDLMTFVKAHGEPVPGTSPYAQFKVMELAKGKVVVTLDGQGADELLAGYHYFFGFYFKELLKHGHIGKLCSEVFYYLTKHKSIFGIKSFIYFLLPESLRNPPHDLKTLASWLYMAAGLTFRGQQDGQVHWLRAAPSAGALYPCEIYVVALSIDGLEPGLYHFCLKDFSLYQLRSGYDTLAQIKRGRPDLEILKTMPGVLLVSTRLWRTAWNYGLRGYRYMAIDAGHLVESLVLAAIGGALGILVAFAGVRIFMAVAPAGLPRLNEVAVSLPVLLFAAGLAAITAIVFGMVPAVSRPSTGQLESRRGHAPKRAGPERAGGRRSGMYAAAAGGDRAGGEQLCAGRDAAARLRLESRDAGAGESVQPKLWTNQSKFGSGQDRVP